MPELPEVETVRAGLQRWVAGRTVAAVEVRHPRSVRRHPGGGADLAARLVGAQVVCASRRGKYLWLPLRRSQALPPRDSATQASEALVAHLGMSGQLIVQPAGAADERHLHVRFVFDDDGPELRFVDQRTFGGMLLDALVPVSDADDAEHGAGGPAVVARAGEQVPGQIAHIARDPLDPAFDDGLFAARLRRRDTELKRALLDQSLISGIGNIYADESLWRARLNGRRRAASLAKATVTDLLGHVRAVLGDAVRAGGTSFDALYVNINGQSGYFDRSLAVYGREARPCPRCGAAIRRAAFMNRSSFFCPRCQRAPRLPSSARPRLTT